MSSDIAALTAALLTCFGLIKGWALVRTFI